MPEPTVRFTFTIPTENGHDRGREVVVSPTVVAGLCCRVFTQQHAHALECEWNDREIATIGQIVLEK